MSNKPIFIVDEDNNKRRGSVMQLLDIEKRNYDDLKILSYGNVNVTKESSGAIEFYNKLESITEDRMKQANPGRLVIIINDANKLSEYLPSKYETLLIALLIMCSHMYSLNTKVIMTSPFVTRLEILVNEVETVSTNNSSKLVVNSDSNSVC